MDRSFSTDAWRPTRLSFPPISLITSQQQNGVIFVFIFFVVSTSADLVLKKKKRSPRFPPTGHHAWLDIGLRQVLCIIERWNFIILLINRSPSEKSEILDIYHSSRRNSISNKKNAYHRLYRFPFPNQHCNLPGIALPSIAAIRFIPVIFIY